MQIYIVAQIVTNNFETQFKRNQKHSHTQSEPVIYR